MREGSFLGQLAPATMRALAAYSKPRRYPADRVLFHQGDPAGHVLLVHGGWLKITSVSRNGSHALLALRGPGDIVGELAVIDGSARSATVTTLSPVMAYFLDGKRFTQAIDELPGFAMALLRHVSRSLRESDQKRLEYVSADTTGRLATLLLQLSTEHGKRTSAGVLIDLPLTQRDLAAAAATSREAVARLFAALRERNVVRTSRRRVEILQPAVLKSLSRSLSDDA